MLGLLVHFQNLHHHYRAYGGWSFAFNDYYQLNITQYMDSNNFELMASIIDPLCEWNYKL